MRALILSLGMLVAMVGGEVIAVESQPMQEFQLPEGMSAIQDLAVDTASGDVWFVEKVGRQLGRFHLADQTFATHSLPEAWGDVGFATMTRGPDGTLWFTVNRGVQVVEETHYLGAFDPTKGVFSQHPLPPGSAPEALQVALDGVVWFLDPDANSVRAYDPRDQSLRDFAIPTPHAQPRGIALARDGLVWFSEPNINRIGKLDPKSGEVTEYDIPTPFANPGAITVDGRGLVWFVEMTSNRLGLFYPDLERFDEAEIPTPRGLPVALAADQENRIWISELRGNQMTRFDPAEATFTSVAVPTFNSLPGEISLDLERQRLWFSESATEAKKLGMLNIGVDQVPGVAELNAAEAESTTAQKETLKGTDSKSTLYLGLILLVILGAVTALALKNPWRGAPK
ncbi:MAG: hypothetical protein HQL52_03235 [Magnetococcales bacterium]|nr:hypothetical protein [Magnetococcales bacterium]